MSRLAQNELGVRRPFQIRSLEQDLPVRRHHRSNRCLGLAGFSHGWRPSPRPAVKSIACFSFFKLVEKLGVAA
jgi:hypothetical protein